MFIPLAIPLKIFLKIYEIAKQNKIKLIEDASHAHGLKINEKYAGNLADISVFSLHQRKAIPVGDGGIITTPNKNIFEKIKKLRSFGHKDLSYNYRMTEFAASIGNVRLERLKNDNLIRSRNASFLISLFKNNQYLEPLKLNNHKPVFYKFLFKIKKPNKMINKMIKNVQINGIPLLKTRKLWNLLHRHPHFNPLKNIARGIPWKKKNIEVK